MAKTKDQNFISRHRGARILEHAGSQSVKVLLIEFKRCCFTLKLKLKFWVIFIILSYLSYFFSDVFLSTPFTEFDFDNIVYYYFDKLHNL